MARWNLVQSNRRIGGWLSRDYEDDYSVCRDDGSECRWFDNKDDAMAYYHKLQAMDDREKLIFEQKRAADETAALRVQMERSNRLDQERFNGGFRPPHSSPTRSLESSLHQLEAQRQAQERLARQLREDAAKANEQQQEFARKKASEVAREELYRRKAGLVREHFEVSGILTYEDAGIFAVCTECKYYGFDNDDLVVEGVKHYAVTDSNLFWHGILFFYGGNNLLLQRIMMSVFDGMDKRKALTATKDSFEAILKDNILYISSWLSSPMADGEMLSLERAKKLGELIWSNNANDLLRSLTVIDGNISKVAFINTAFQFSSADRCPELTFMKTQYVKYEKFRTALQTQWSMVGELSVVFERIKEKIAVMPYVDDENSAVFGDLKLMHSQALAILPDMESLQSCWRNYSIAMDQLPKVIADAESQLNVCLWPKLDFNRFSLEAPHLPMDVFIQSMLVVCRYLGRLNAYWLHLTKTRKRNGLFSYARKKASALLNRNRPSFKGNVVAHDGGEPLKTEVLEMLKQKFYKEITIRANVEARFYHAFKNGK